MQALHDVVQAGYVRYIGMSSCYAYQCRWHIYLDPSTKLTIASITYSPRDAECVNIRQLDRGDVHSLHRLRN